MSQKHNFLFYKVPTQVLIVDVPLFLAKYFRQFPRKDVFAKNKAPIKKGAKTKNILERILKREIKVTPKELWTVVLKLYTTLKEILTSKQPVKENPDTALEIEEDQPQKNLVLVNSLERPQISQESLKIKEREVIEV